MRRLASLVLVLLAVPCIAQSYPDVEALLDFAFATDPGVVARHLPVSLLKELEQLPPQQQLDFERSLMPMEQLKNEDLIFERSESPPTLIELHNKNESDREKAEKAARLVLDRRICDGYESLLRLRLLTADKKDSFNDAMLLVWMRFEEGEWRLVELESGEGHDRENFEDAAVIEKFRARTGQMNEIEALTSLRSYSSALASYSANFETTGFPSRLEALGCTWSGGGTAEHSCLLDGVLSTAPFEKSGYRFTYRPLLQSGPTRYYTLLARPIDYGTSGKRNYFMEETGAIHWTDEDREATAADPRMQ